MKNIANLFESIKESLNKKTSGESAFADMLKLETDKTYIVRLLPNVHNPDRTFFHYYHHIWKSVVTGNTISTLCPNTYEEKCPIDEFRSSVYRTKDEDKIKETYPLKRNESWLVNCYVIKDPTNSENEGKVKILRYGKQLDKIITAAISGDDADEFGSKVFDLSEKGCNLKIKVEKNEGGYPTYVASKFTSPSEIVGLDEDDFDSVYEQTRDLDNIFNHKSYDEIKSLLKVHWFGETEADSETEVAPKSKKEESSVLTQAEATPTKTTVKDNSVVEEFTDKAVESNDIDDEMQKLLDNL
jgi:hypothetical protein